MEEMKMQDIVTIAAGEARAEAYLNVVKTMLLEYYPDTKLMRKILGVAEPETPDYLKKTEGEKNAE